MSRNFSISTNSWSGTVLNLDIKFSTYTRWISEYRLVLNLAQMLLGDFYMDQVQHSHLGHLGIHLLHWALPPAVLLIFEIFADFEELPMMIFAVMVLVHWLHTGHQYHVSCKITWSHCQYKHNQNSKCLCLIKFYCSYHINASAM